MTVEGETEGLLVADEWEGEATQAEGGATAS
jgi:hypothetical protein